MRENAGHSSVEDRFEHKLSLEKGRKIICTQKHFRATGADCRFVDDKDDKWYEQEHEEYDNILSDMKYPNGNMTDKTEIIKSS
ncbi:MAG TPA: hypothetical protein DCO86_01715 [Spirochaetaceae bacterium]|nr:hypothetical protein [Spirochaetaceae bacterium]